MLGVLNIHKPGGITSHDVVQRVRKKLGTKRVGHAGTLDPMATGVLVVAVGPATRFLQYLPLEPKVYEGKIRFGITTDSQDAEGKVLDQREVPDDLSERIKAELPALTGEIRQIPPMFSAIKQGGTPLYDLARKGIEVEREPRTVFIESFEILQLHGEEAEFRVQCSGGTYVRTLAHDLGHAVGCGAHLTELVRTHVGKFKLRESITLDEVSAHDLVPLTDALAPTEMFKLDAEHETLVRHGMPIKKPPHLSEEWIALQDAHRRVFAMAHSDGTWLRPECVIPLEALDGLVQPG